MASLALFQSFDKENYIEEQNIRPIELYTLSNLNSNYSPCKWHWEKQYNLCNKLYIVCHWQKAKELRPIAKKQCVTANWLIFWPTRNIKTVSVQVVNGVGKTTYVF